MASILGMVKLQKGQDLVDLVDQADQAGHARDPMAQADRAIMTVLCIKSLSMWVCPIWFLLFIRKDACSNVSFRTRPFFEASNRPTKTASPRSTLFTPDGTLGVLSISTSRRIPHLGATTPIHPTRRMRILRKSSSLKK